MQAKEVSVNSVIFCYHVKNFLFCCNKRVDIFIMEKWEQKT